MELASEPPKVRFHEVTRMGEMDVIEAVRGAGDKGG